jgi:SpoIID/LytB domain protein
MAQDSAHAMAVAGADHERILSHFYPGTGRALRSSVLRVLVWEAGAPTGEVSVSVPQGARVSSDGGSAQARPGAVLRIVVDGSGYHVREVMSAQPAAQRGAAVRAALMDESSSPSPSPSDSGDPLPNILPTVAPPPSPSSQPSTGAPSPRASPAIGSPRPTRSGRATPSPSSTATPPVSLDSSGPVTVTPPAGGITSVAATGRAYRGEVTALARAGFRLVNALDIEDYLHGLGEVPAGWPMPALRAQAVAARTYALRAVGGPRPLGYDICDDTRCQVYLGVTGESAREAQAAGDTRGEVVTFRGGLADTFYSANAGGVTATPAEGFGGSTTIPYLPGGVRAPGGVDPWKLTVSPEDVATRLGYSGRLDAFVVALRGPSGRAVRLRLQGSAGVLEISGIEAQRRLGLRSTLFTVTRATGTAQSLPPPTTEPTQLPPAEAAEAPPIPQAAQTPSVVPDGEARSLAVAESDLPSWSVVVAALLIVLAVFAAVLTRRAQLTRGRS